MAISQQILDQIKYDFYTGADTQTFDILIDDPFWEWFMNNANQYMPCQDCDALYPEDQNMAGNCFGNSQRFAVREGVEYCEGFMRVRNCFIFHGFNLFDDCVLDCTLHSNQNQFIDDNGLLPNVYYGVVIPNNLYENNMTDDCINNPINLEHEVYNYFLDTH
jgi:hypothetical protein